ncbi:hypothetical protein TPE_0181 [Treponema pedis str. T A4]|uniref:Uncharacterized protein n=1 Tax=Treponema pedis str. T A4 TaxID=1291379 RepID=S5ZJG0_9SPIR|nr:hypothetical protein TPE_0181 [Treponema pedis str. T A4]
MNLFRQSCCGWYLMFLFLVFCKKIQKARGCFAFLNFKDKNEGCV